MAYRKKAAQAETGIIPAAKYQRRQTAADTDPQSSQQQKQ